MYRRFPLGLFAGISILSSVACGNKEAEDTEKKAEAEPICSDDDDCDDGLFCNGTEICAPGHRDADDFGCRVTEVPDCDDEIECTVDSCEEDKGSCLHEAPDEDGDGHADQSCEDVNGEPLGDDCDDEDSNRYPGNTETCDEHHDEDCDDTTFGQLDEDGDGAISDECCNDDNCGDDCNDQNIAQRPLQPEFCDDLDNNCDGLVDNDTQEVAWYPDEDGDLFGDRHAAAVSSCFPIEGRSLVATDCADDSADSNPAAREICEDDVDNDCDSIIDEGPRCADPEGRPADASGIPPVVSCSAGTYAKGAQCLGWTNCEPGEFVKRAASPTRDRECASCEDGTFSETNNTSECGQWTECESDEWEKTSPTSVRDRICTTHRDCVPGEYLAQAGTSEGDTVCLPCAAGSFSTESNQAQCVLWTDCVPGQSVETAGSPEADRVCEDCTGGLSSTEPNAEDCGVSLPACLSSAWRPCSCDADKCEQTLPSPAGFFTERFYEHAVPDEAVAALTFSPPGSAFGGKLIVHPYRRIWEINSSGVGLEHATMDEGLIQDMIVTPASSAFGGDIFAPNQQQGYPANNVFRLENDRRFTELYRTGSAYYPRGVALDLSGTYGGLLFVSFPGGAPGDIVGFDPEGVMSTLVTDGAAGFGANDIDFAPGTAFGSGLYALDQGEDCNCLRSVDDSGDYSEPLSYFSSTPVAMAFGRWGPWIDKLYVALQGGSLGMEIVQVTPDGTITPFMGGFMTRSPRPGALSFDSDGHVLYIADADRTNSSTYNANVVYRVVPEGLCQAELNCDPSGP